MVAGILQIESIHTWFFLLPLYENSHCLFREAVHDILVHRVDLPGWKKCMGIIWQCKVTVVILL